MPLRQRRRAALEAARGMEDEVSERTTALVGLWRHVNEIATTTEDRQAIRNLIAEARIEPGNNVGRPEADYLDDGLLAEYMLGQWAELIDIDFPLLNTARNISLAWYEDRFGGAA